MALLLVRRRRLSRVGDQASFLVERDWRMRGWFSGTVGREAARDDGLEDLSVTTTMDPREKLAGVLLGAAVGDALGLPREGLSRRRAARLYGPGPLRHRFLLGRGMVSDDAEHACMTAQALLVAGGDETRFARSLAWRLRGWLASMPPGVGWGTLRAIFKLWLGFPPGRSGVASAGNGPAMRAPILGAYLARTPDRIAPFVRASTRLTHRDPRAEEGALAIALAAAYAVERRPDEIDATTLLGEIRAHVTVEALRDALDTVAEHLARGASAVALASALGSERGVTGFVLHTVPAALFCWLANPGDIRQCVEEVIGLGGDADSTGAIVGALAGATAGAGAIPEQWLSGIVEWPRSITWMRRLADRLAGRLLADEQTSIGPLPLFWPALPVRNLFFLAVALAHGLRRLLPPY
jgi:ADP-ribosyl-[dinitrogen reductase] hydrolase